MRKRMAAAAAAAAMLLSACAAGDGINVKTLTDESESDKATVYTETFEFSGLKNREYQSQLNEELLGITAESVNKFEKLAEDTELSDGIKAALNIRQGMKLNDKGIISFVTENYVYLGGAHGNTEWVPYTVNTNEETPHRLELRELFIDENEYIDTINRLIDEAVEADKERYSGLWAEPHINAEDNQQSYYLTDEELVIFFPPYELSYYAKGFIEFPIRRTELNRLLKEEYRIKSD